MAPPKGADLKQNEREECEQGVREEGATNGGGGPQQLLEEPPPTAAGGLLTRSRAGSQRLLQRMSTGVFNHHPGSFFRRRPTEAETGKKNGVVLAPGEDAIGKPEKKDKAATKSTACAIMWKMRQKGWSRINLKYFPGKTGLFL